MAGNTTLELVEYYKNLLIFQYVNKPNASGTIGELASLAIMPQTSVQTISFSLEPTSGSFILSYNDENSDPIDWDDSSSTIQTKLRVITGLSEITVEGSIEDLLLTITFVNVPAPAYMLIEVSNTLVATATPVSIEIVETDKTLPLAVQDAFNILEGTQIATGVQLDVIGKYVGVSRSGEGFTSPITLDDDDYIQFIRMAIVKNSAGSSLSIIQDYIHSFFPGQMFVYDSRLMFMTFLIAESLGSEDLMQLFITEGLLPVPMAVGYAVIYGPTAEYFSCSTYEYPDLVNGFGLNTYEDYQMDWPWLQYQNVIFP